MAASCTRTPRPFFSPGFLYSYVLRLSSLLFLPLSFSFSLFSFFVLLVHKRDEVIRPELVLTCQRPPLSSAGTSLWLLIGLWPDDYHQLLQSFGNGANAFHEEFRFVLPRDEREVHRH